MSEYAYKYCSGSCTHMRKSPNWKKFPHRCDLYKDRLHKARGDTPRLLRCGECYEDSIRGNDPCNSHKEKKDADGKFKD